jgi:hypothetical protein
MRSWLLLLVRDVEPGSVRLQRGEERARLPERRAPPHLPITPFELRIARYDEHRGLSLDLALLVEDLDDRQAGEVRHREPGDRLQGGHVIERAREDLARLGEQGGALPAFLLPGEELGQGLLGLLPLRDVRLFPELQRAGVGALGRCRC